MATQQVSGTRGLTHRDDHTQQGPASSPGGHRLPPKTGATGQRKVFSGICEVPQTLSSGENIQTWPLRKHFSSLHEEMQTPSSPDGRPTPAKLRRGLRGKPTQSMETLTLPEKRALSPGLPPPGTPPTPLCRGLQQITDHQPWFPPPLKPKLPFKPCNHEAMLPGAAPRAGLLTTGEGSSPGWASGQLPAPPGRSPTSHLQAFTHCTGSNVERPLSQGGGRADMPAGGVGGQGHQHQDQPRCMEQALRAPPRPRHPIALRPWV